jgi:hypothetical protein
MNTTIEPTYTINANKCVWCDKPFDPTKPFVGLIEKGKVRHYHEDCYSERRRCQEEDLIEWEEALAQEAKDYA